MLAAETSLLTVCVEAVFKHNSVCLTVGHRIPQHLQLLAARGLVPTAATLEDVQTGHILNSPAALDIVLMWSVAVVAKACGAQAD